MVAASPVIEGLVRNGSSDLRGCCSVLDVSYENLAKVKAPMLSKTDEDYMLRWTRRGALLAGLSMRGQTMLPGKATVEDLMKCSPDVGNWIQKISRHFYSSQGTAQAMPVNMLLKKLGYTGKLEHLSRWLCFLAKQDMACAAPTLVKERTPELLALLRATRKRTGMWPTPMVLVKKAQERGIL